MDIADLLRDVLAETGVPSVAAAVVLNDKLHAAGAVGVRKRGDDTPVTVNDRYHIGSCAKAMTATLAAILVERRLLSWETTLRDVFPTLTKHPVCEEITLRQLLSHASGLASFTDSEAEDPDLVKIVFGTYETPRQGRLEVVVPALLSREPHTLPGTAFNYSNMGYVVAGAVLEALPQTSFETLLQSEVFGPLELTSAGFGHLERPVKWTGSGGTVPSPSSRDRTRTCRWFWLRRVRYICL